MKFKYLATGVVVGTILLTSNNIEKPTHLEKIIQTTIISQPSDTNNLPTSPSEPTPENPNDYDLISNMKAILQPEEKIYDERKQVVL